MPGKRQIFAEKESVVVSFHTHNLLPLFYHKQMKEKRASVKNLRQKYVKITV